MAKVERERVYESEIGFIYWDDRGQWVELESKAMIESEQFRAMAGMTLQVMEQKRAHKMLVNVFKLDRMIGPEDMVWTETEWFPRCLKGGMKSVAVVMPRSLTSYVSLDKFTQKFDPDSGGFQRRFFSDPEEARKWLSQQ